MTLIPFREANPVPKPGSYVVNGFDVAAALKAGGGIFTVDDSTQGALVLALEAFPGVYRADGKGPQAVSVPMAFRGAWQPNTAYSANDAVANAGSLYVAPGAFVSGASFNVANWTLVSPAPSSELQVAEFAPGFNVNRAGGGTLTGGKMLDGTSADTAYAEPVGWTLPALAAQDRPYDIVLSLANFRTGAANVLVTWEVVKQSAQLATPSAAWTDALTAGGNGYIQRAVFFGVAFAQDTLTSRRRIPPGVAVPALKVRYKSSAAVNNGCDVGAGIGESVISRLEQVAR